MVLCVYSGCEISVDGVVCVQCSVDGVVCVQWM